LLSRLPLETDLTTPLAYFLARSDLQEVGYAGFLRPDQEERKSGIYTFEPYQAGKIPVVMVHGLLSSPLTWLAMFNDLRADPQLRERSNSGSTCIRPAILTWSRLQSCAPPSPGCGRNWTPLARTPPWITWSWWGTAWAGWWPSC